MRLLLFLLSLLCVQLPSAGPALAAPADETVLFRKDSLYQHIVVLENTRKRERYIHNVKRDYMQGGIAVDRPEELLFEYTRTSFVSLAFLEREPQDILFIGLGAGAMPRYLQRYYPEASIDVVELDPDMLAVAKEYFHFRESGGMKAHVQDGRIFVKRTAKQYDMIFLDAYKNDSIPFHLTTVEFLGEVKKKLRKGGVVVSNITASFRNKFFDAMLRTYQEAFPHLYLFRDTKAIGFSTYYIFIAQEGGARRQRDEVVRRARELRQAKDFDIDLPMLAMSYEYPDDGAAAEVLTDDFAPVNIYMHTESR
ncbi:MAG: fused MFS/spermidine synthase [Thermodesulfobacteriota bacterium]